MFAEPPFFFFFFFISPIKLLSLMIVIVKARNTICHLINDTNFTISGQIIFALEIYAHVWKDVNPFLICSTSPPYWLTFFPLSPWI